MKSTVAIIFLVASLTALYWSAEGTSPRKCDQCDRDLCPSTEGCKCKTFMDECDCCARCFKCEDEECLIVAHERCEGDFSCKHPPGSSYLDKMNKPGRCQ